MPSELDRVQVSQRLHARVRDFATRSLRGGTSFEPGGEPREGVEREFEALACEIAAHQSGKVLTSLAEVVRQGVVSDCFRLGRVFSFEPPEAKLRFVTSGTTSAKSGVHYMRESATYEALSLSWGKRGLGFRDDEPPPLVVALAPWTGVTTSSSLGYMMQRFMERFDGRSLTPERDAAGFVLNAPERWLVSASGVEIAALARVCELARRVGSRVVLLATSFALVELIDSVGGETFEVPAGSVIMPTGGFKGRTRTIEPAAMHRELRRVFGDVDIVGEYGMTELTSQLYEERARLSESAGGGPGVYLAPPWLRVVPLEPATLQPSPRGAVGLACFIDLGNVDSAVCLLTQDLVRVEGETRLGGDRVQLLGRQPKAPLRGCSLAIEALLRPVPTWGDAGLQAPMRTEETPSGESGAIAPLDDVLVEVAMARVAEVTGAAAALFARAGSDPGDETVRSLAESSGLSPEGVRLALELSLEASVTPRDMGVLVRTVQRAYRVTEGAVWVLLSSNVFSAPLRAIAIAKALSSRVKVRPSRRDPRFAQLLSEMAPGSFDIVSELAPIGGDVVLAYGSDDTLETVRASMPPGVRFFGHGHGMGVAVIGAGADLPQAASALALDVVLFDQQGCASPRLVLIDATNDVEEFVGVLSSALATWEERVPVGPSEPEHVHEAVWSERVANNFGRVFKAGSGWLACYDSRWAHQHEVPVPPPCRSLSIVSSDDLLPDVVALEALVTTVGIAGDPALQERLRQSLPGARIVPLGVMQRPLFDGPVDRRRLSVHSTNID